MKMTKLVNQEEFERLTGNAIPPQRNMNTFKGDVFSCSCGGHHEFGIDNIEILAEGMNGKFVITCPKNSNLTCLIKTKMKWGIVFQGFELIAGCER